MQRRVPGQDDDSIGNALRERARRMIMRHLALAALLLAGACAATPDAVTGGAPRQPPGCAVTLEAEVAGRFDSNTLVIPAEGGGAPLRLQVDTGDSEQGSLSRATVRQLALNPVSTGRQAATVVGGVVPVVHVRLPGFSIGGLPPVAAWMAVQPTEAHVAGNQPVDGILGAGLLSRFDLEIDPEARAMRLHSASGCEQGLVPFAEPYVSVPLRRGPGNLLFAPIAIDGVPLMALLDTGSNGGITLLRPGAERLGIVPGAPGEIGMGRLRDWSGRQAEVRVRVAQSVVMGPMRAERVPIALIVPAPGGPTPLAVADAILGGAFLLRHRVWISYATGMLHVARRLPST
ncbi:aspartyl protease family protein [Elioraea rosea]|uniref:aspartyl protease family protein n=1 Tax=Elioraea rosea TaxID=2492390 RepID=UPI001183C8FE|nr:aspartyl protease family protein [Elioraea rosea]